MKGELTEMKDKMTAIERKQEEAKVGQDLKVAADLLCNFNLPKQFVKRFTSPSTKTKYSNCNLLIESILNVRKI